MCRSFNEELEDAGRFVGNAIAIITAVTNEPDDVFPASRNELIGFLKTIHLAICEKVTHQLPAFHAKRNKGIAFANWTHFYRICQKVGIKVGNVRSCLLYTWHDRGLKIED